MRESQHYTGTNHNDVVYCLVRSVVTPNYLLEESKEVGERKNI